MNLAHSIAKWRASPAMMVRDLFSVEPQPWQAKTLDAFPDQQRIAMLTCVGAGRTTMLAWLGWNFMLTRLHAKGCATSATKSDLDANLWADLAMWRSRSEVLQKYFEIDEKRICSRENPNDWWLHRRVWSDKADLTNQMATLAGLCGAGAFENGFNSL